MHPDPLWTLDLAAIPQLALAVLCGGAIGLEREARGRAAGLRTMILVCLGSTLIMIVSHRLSSPVLQDDGVQEAILRVDPGRIAAGIVTGIGFLGAAVVLKLGDLIRGVTTAASIWFVAALGIVIGETFYGLALLATAAGLVVLWLFQYIERLIPSPLYRDIRLTIERPRSPQVLEQAYAVLQRRDLRLLEVQTQETRADDRSEVLLRIRTRRPLDSPYVVRELVDIEGVERAEWFG